MKTLELTNQSPKKELVIDQKGILKTIVLGLPHSPLIYLRNIPEASATSFKVGPSGINLKVIGLVAGSMFIVGAAYYSYGIWQQDQIEKQFLLQEEQRALAAQEQLEEQRMLEEEAAMAEALAMEEELAQEREDIMSFLTDLDTRQTIAYQNFLSLVEDKSAAEIENAEWSKEASDNCGATPGRFIPAEFVDDYDCIATYLIQRIELLELRVQEIEIASRSPSISASQSNQNSQLSPQGNAEATHSKPNRQEQPQANRENVESPGQKNQQQMDSGQPASSHEQEAMKLFGDIMQKVIKERQ